MSNVSMIYFPGGKMHLSQVWTVGHSAGLRRSLRAATQHHQREDLRLPLVLVRDPLHHHRHPDDLPGVHLLPAAHAHHAAQRALQGEEAGPGGAHLQDLQAGRLVRAVPARQEHRPPDLQGVHRGPVRPARLLGRGEARHAESVLTCSDQ